MNHTDQQSFDQLFRKNSLTDALTQLGFFADDQGIQKRMCSDFWRSLGYDEGDLNDRRLREICHPDDREVLEGFFSTLGSGAKGISQAIFRIRSAEGRWIWIRRSGTLVKDGQDGDSGLYVGLDTDLTEFKETEERLRTLTVNSELHVKEMESLLNAATVITSSLDVDEAVRRILEQAKAVIPLDKASVQLIQNGALELIGGIGFEDISKIIGLRFPYPAIGSLSTLAIEEKRIVVCKDVTRDFPGFIMAERNKPTRSWMGIPLIARGNVFGLLSFNHMQENYYSERHVQLASGFAVHVAVALENARLYEKTFKLAMEDALMGIGSRHLFNVQGAVMYENARRKKTVLSLALVDLDHFKSVNDTYGHENGDLVLKEIGRLCRQEYRITDLAARYGGEEIIFLFPETDVETAVRLSDRLRKVIDETEFGPVGKSVTISTGIASEIPDQTSTLANLLNCADSALYAAKRNGRNRIEVYKSA